jgi:hypothetical protein
MAINVPVAIAEIEDKKVWKLWCCIFSIVTFSLCQWSKVLHRCGSSELFSCAVRASGSYKSCDLLTLLHGAKFYTSVAPQNYSNVQWEHLSSTKSVMWPLVLTKFNLYTCHWIFVDQNVRQHQRKLAYQHQIWRLKE